MATAAGSKRLDGEVRETGSADVPSAVIALWNGAALFSQNRRITWVVAVALAFGLGFVAAKATSWVSKAPSHGGAGSANRLPRAATVQDASAQPSVAPRPAAQPRPDAVIAAAEDHFTYHGKAISPHLIKQFMCQMADDGGAAIREVDVTNAFRDDNQYDDSDVWVSGGGVGFDKKKPRSFFAYYPLGHLADGTAVVETTAWGGGSGIFEDLLFLRFHQARGKPGHLLLTLLHDFPVGDRYVGKIALRRRSVVLPAYNGPGDKVYKKRVYRWPPSTR